MNKETGMKRNMQREELAEMILHLTKKNLELEERLEQARKREKIWYELWREKN